MVTASGTVIYLMTTRGSVDTDRQVLLRSADRGRHFQRVSAPIAETRARRRLRVRRLVFINELDGYALLGQPGLGGTLPVAMSTTDGGTSWRRVRIGAGHRMQVAAVSGHGRRVFAVTMACRGDNRQRCGTAALYTSTVGSGHWRRTRAELPRRDNAGGVGLAAWGSTVWLTLGEGSSPHPVTLRSTDGGGHFTHSPSPAGLSCHPTATSTRVAWTTCGTGMLLAFTRSHDGAARRLPITGAGTTGTFLDPLTDTTAYAGSSVGRNAGLWTTRDRGRSFHRVAPLPERFTRSPFGFEITFLDRHIGLANLPGQGLYRTSDAGHHWTPVTLPPDQHRRR